MSLRWKGWSLGLTTSGLLLVALALVWLLVIFPIMAKMPTPNNNAMIKAIDFGSKINPDDINFPVKLLNPFSRSSTRRMAIIIANNV